MPTGSARRCYLPWPGGTLPDWGSAVARTELDDHLRTTAIKSGATAIDGVRAVDVRREGRRVAAVVMKEGSETFEIACRRLVVADGVRSPLGKVLGRAWHRDTVYAVAGRSYVDSEMSDDPWISSHLELRGEDGDILSGYGWIFPLGTGEVNVGVGTLATDRAARQGRDQAAHAALHRRDRAPTSGSPASCARPRRPCCRWVARCPTSPGPTGPSSATPPRA